jgi:transcription elongation factor Elf1
MRFTRTIPARKISYEAKFAKPFMTYNQVLEIRDSHGIKTSKTCLLCGHKFKSLENLFLAYVVNHGGKIICESCGTKCKSPK